MFGCLRTDCSLFQAIKIQYVASVYAQPQQTTLIIPDLKWAFHIFGYPAMPSIDLIGHQLFPLCQSVSHRGKIDDILTSANVRHLNCAKATRFVQQRYSIFETPGK